MPTATEQLEAALAHHRAGRLDEAEDAYKRLLDEDAASADATHLLGMVHQRQGKTDDAVQMLARACELDPTAPHFHANLGACLARLGRRDDALQHLTEAVRLRPDYPEAWSNLALCLERMGRTADAADAYQHLTRLRPGDAAAWLRNATACRKANRPGAAIYALKKAIALDPNQSNVWHALASSQGDLGRYREAADAFRKAAELDPTNPHVGSDLVHLLHYDPDAKPGDLLAAAKAWAARHAEPLTAKAPAHDPAASGASENRRLRIGYVSGDFREHPVGRLAVPILTHLDRDRFDIFCYDDARRGDGVTKRMKALPSITWRPTPELSDEALAAQIRADQIDVLVDLAGHMGGHRLTAFAQKPAPVQVTHFNYPDTTGMTAMDWRMSDTLAEPAGEADHYSVERLCRLDPAAWCYDAGTQTPPVGPLPALANGYVTFGSLNKPLKHSEPTAALWAQVLAAVPGSKLMLLGLADEKENVLLYEWFATHGVDRERLLFVPRQARQGYLDLYNQIDIALDPFPYNGGITTCDALYMGVPLITLEGTTYHSRQGLMILTNLGLPELIAKTPQQYVRLAAYLAEGLPLLAQLRSELRQRLENSPIMDAPAFARRLGEAYQAMATHGG